MERPAPPKGTLLREISDLIRSGEWQTGRKLPTERALATQFKVSRSSVQQALRDLESMGLVEREPNCRPVVAGGRSKKQYASPRTADQIAVWILPDLQDLGGSLMLQGIRSVCGANNYRLLIDCTPANQHKEVVEQAELDFIHALRNDPSIAGAIIWETGSPGFEKAFSELQEANIPVVFVDREPLGSVEADVVMTNHRRAAKKAVQHLIDLGHRKIAMVVNHERATSVLDRVDGYRSTLLEAGIVWRDDYLVELPLEAVRDFGSATTQVLADLTRMDDPPTAIFAVNDKLALHLMESAKEMGISIPGDFSLVGFDWLMRYLPSGGDLTTIAQPFQEIGSTAARRLLHRLHSDTQEVTRHVLLDAPLVVRSSSVPAFTKQSFQPKGETHATTP